MPSIVTQTLSTPVVQSVTVTLDADEVFMIVNALNVRGYTMLGAAMRALLDPKPVEPVTPADFLAKGTLDGFIQSGHIIPTIKALRTEFAHIGLGLKDARDAVEARKKALGL